MENASKALIIAGGVLISLMVVSVLFVFRNNISSFMASKRDEELAAQTLQFNNQFDVYNSKNVQGSEFLSLVNKVKDYNLKYREEDGYTRLDISVKFKNNIVAYEGEVVIKAGREYTTDDIFNEILSSNGLEQTIKKLGKEKEPISGKTIEALSGMRTNQLQQALGINIDAEGTEKQNNDKTLAAVQKKINTFLGYRSALSNFKSKTFSATEFNYNKDNGMITLMKFQEN